MTPITTLSIRTLSPYEEANPALPVKLIPPCGPSDSGGRCRRRLRGQEANRCNLPEHPTPKRGLIWLLFGYRGRISRSQFWMALGFR